MTFRKDVTLWKVEVVFRRNLTAGTLGLRRMAGRIVTARFRRAGLYFRFQNLGFERGRVCSMRTWI